MRQARSGNENSDNEIVSRDCADCVLSFEQEDQRKEMRKIDADSLLRQIKIRQKWHKDIDIDEIIIMIKEAPTVDENCTKDAQ